MSGEKFTKGKWVAYTCGNDDDLIVVSEYKGEMEPVISKVYEKADADLVSVAPEMYAMLERILNSSKQDVGGGFLTYEESKGIKDLLAKARGENV